MWAAKVEGKGYYQGFRLVMVMLVLAAALVPFGQAQARAGQLTPNTFAIPPVRVDAAGAFSIFGPDDRFQVTNTRAFPWSAVAQVRIYWSEDDLVGYSCTGWMIGPSALATAAHCIYQDGYPVRVVVKPAMNADDPDQTPFGTCPVVGWVVPEAWVEDHNIEYDYGVYHLGCTIGKKTGTLGFKMTDGDQTQQPVQLTGYPKDKPGRTMWSGLGKVTASSAKGLHYDADMRPGQSGSPVWDPEDQSCRYCVVAINSSEFGAPAMNFGARIDREAFEFLRAGKAYRAPETGGE